MFLWDIKQVLDCLKKMIGGNNQLSNKELTLKVTILLALEHHLEYQLFVFWI